MFSFEMLLDDEKLDNLAAFAFNPISERECKAPLLAGLLYNEKYLSAILRERETGCPNLPS